MTLNYSYTLDPRLHYQATRALSSRSSVHWWLYGIAFAIPFLLVLLNLAGGDTLQEALSHALWFTIVPLTVIFGLPVLSRWQIRRYFARTPSLMGEQTFTFSDAGIEMSGRLADVTLRWEAIVEVSEHRGFFLFYFSKGAAYYFPVSAVPPDEQEELRTLITGYIGDRAKF